jgi:hypothetical protein
VGVGKKEGGRVCNKERREGGEGNCAKREEEQERGMVEQAVQTEFSS